MVIKNIPDFLFSIAVDLPATNSDGEAVRDEKGEVIYETNYFCKVLRDPRTGAQFIEWDTDKRFCARFPSAVMAENFRRVVLGSLDGSKVVEMKPLQAGKKKKQFFGLLVTEQLKTNTDFINNPGQ